MQNRVFRLAAVTVLTLIVASILSGCSTTQTVHNRIYYTITTEPSGAELYFYDKYNNTYESIGVSPVTLWGKTSYQITETATVEGHYDIDTVKLSEEGNFFGGRKIIRARKGELHAEGEIYCPDITENVGRDNGGYSSSISWRAKPVDEDLSAHFILN